MRNVLIIARRELYAYFASPVAYVVTTAFLAVAGYFFSLILFFSQEATLRFWAGNLVLILLFLAPLLTMRLIAEERRMGTIELLLTSPIRDWELVVGKFLGGLGLFAVMLLLTGIYPLILFRLGNPDPGPMLSAYLGLLLFGSTLLAAGLFTSSLTQNQVVAAVLGIGLVLVIFLLDAAGNFVGGRAGEVLGQLAMGAHFDDMTRGVIDTRDVVYFLSAIALFLFLTTRVVEVQRWR
ncbi:MAG TPA: ABC transporter permease [Ardenticatenaceae bacterium]|nr:ABC transporter permease [Ardenticatenaceae bacterium]